MQSLALICCPCVCRPFLCSSREELLTQSGWMEQHLALHRQRFTALCIWTACCVALTLNGTVHDSIRTYHWLSLYNVKYDVYFWKSQFYHSSITACGFSIRYLRKMLLICLVTFNLCRWQPVVMHEGSKDRQPQWNYLLLFIARYMVRLLGKKPSSGSYKFI